jgi:hypothetical protein
LSFSPGILHETETVAVIFDGSEKRVGMVILDTLSSEFIVVGLPVLPSSGTEQELFVHLEKTFCPQLVFIKDVC